MTFIARHRLIIAFTSVCLVVYTGLLLLLNGAGIYEIGEGTNNDRFFSMDDVYYITRIYSPDMDTSLRIVKHPLFIVFGNITARLFNALWENPGYPSTYILVIVLQIFLQLLALIYLYKILSEFYRPGNRVILILLAIYAFSVSSLAFTLIAESYIFSGAALIMSYYYLLKKNTAAAIILGIITAGITITNFAVWVIMAVLLTEGRKRKLLIVSVTTSAFVLTITITPASLLFFNNFLTVMVSSPGNYSDSFDLYAVIVRCLYSFFGSTVFFIDTIKESPFGQFPGRAISFLPGSGGLIPALMLLWAGLLIYSAVLNLRNRLLYVPMAVLAFNLVLHGVLQYGLKEAFLYSLHHFFAQALIIASVFLPDGKNALKVKKPASALLALLVFFFAGEILLNAAGYMEFYAYISALAGKALM